MAERTDPVRKLHDAAIGELQGAIADLKLSREGRRDSSRYHLIQRAMWKADALLREIQTAEEEQAKREDAKARAAGAAVRKWTTGRLIKE